MATAAHTTSHTRPLATAKPSTIPWYLWCAALAVTSVTIGAHWDVSWHRSIGRDTFWTPAHMAIYLCGVLAGISCGYLILRYLRAHRGTYLVLGPRLRLPRTSRRLHRRVGRHRHAHFRPLRQLVACRLRPRCENRLPAAHAAHARHLRRRNRRATPHPRPHESRYRGPRRARCWRDGVGRHARARSPVAHDVHLRSHDGPHHVLPHGIHLGRHAPPRRRVHLHRHRRPPLLRRHVEGLAPSLGLHPHLRLLHAGHHRLHLILPLFPASPKLGPVFQPVTQFIPPKFPILLIVPAIALDLLWRRYGQVEGQANKILLSLASGPLFVLTLVAAEWPFASFLMTNAAKNRFFGAGYLDYGTPSWSLDATRHFVQPQHGLDLWIGLAEAMLYAAISVWLGLLLGDWMRKVKR